MKIIAPILAALFIGGFIGWKLVGSTPELTPRQILIIALVMMFSAVYALFQLSSNADIADRLKNQ